MGYGSNRGKNRGYRSDGRRPGSSSFSGGRFGGYRRFGGSSGSQNAPVEVGKEYEVQITELSRRGEGIARVQGFVIFVAGGKPNEQKVKIKIERVSPRFASASLANPSSSEPVESASDSPTENVNEDSENGTNSSDLVEPL